MEKIITSLEDSFNELFALETIIILTKEACSDREFNAVYYDLSSDSKTTLSEERNHYINMLTIALDKIYNIKETLTIAENKAYDLQQYTHYSSR